MGGSEDTSRETWALKQAAGPPGLKIGWCKCMKVAVHEEYKGIGDWLHLCTHRMHGKKRIRVLSPIFQSHFTFFLWCVLHSFPSKSIFLLLVGHPLTTIDGLSRLSLNSPNPRSIFFLSVSRVRERRVEPRFYWGKYWSVCSSCISVFAVGHFGCKPSLSQIRVGCTTKPWKGQ